MKIRVELNYPEKNGFTIDDFRADRAMKMAEYYLHVVDNETGSCWCITCEFSFERAMELFKEYSKECKEGYHIEMTVGIQQAEARARIK